MSASRNGRGKKRLILVGLFLVLLLGAYGYGRWQGAQHLRSGPEPAGVGPGARDLDARGARAEQVTADLARLEGEAQSLRNQVHLLQARRRLHLALMALDERNFGTARDHLNAAGRNLEAVSPAPADGDTGVLRRLSQELSSAQLTASDNVGADRQRVLSWVRELERHLPAEEGVAESQRVSPGEPSEVETPEAPSISPSGATRGGGSGPL